MLKQNHESEIRIIDSNYVKLGENEKVAKVVYTKLITDMTLSNNIIEKWNQDPSISFSQKEFIDSIKFSRSLMKVMKYHSFQYHF